MSVVESRGTVTIEAARCKGCELCIPACPPGVLSMSDRRNELGYAYPELVPGCTGCGACLLVCPDFCFEVYQYETPVAHEVATATHEAATATHEAATATREASTATREVAP